MMNRKRAVVIGLGALFVISAFLFGIYDLTISRAVVNQASAFGRIFELLGVLVAPALAVFAGASLAVWAITEKSAVHRKFMIVCGAVGILAGAVYCGFIFAKISAFAVLIYTICCLLLICGYVRFLLHTNAEMRWRLMRVSVVYLVYIVVLLIGVSILKLCWGRIRFRQLSDFSDFSPWFLPQGITGYVSFPSGHTANAAAFYAITLFVPYIKHKAGKVLCYLIPIIWIIVMAASRVVVGAHYASDVLFGAAISIVLFYWVRHIVFSKFLPEHKK